MGRNQKCNRYNREIRAQEYAEKQQKQRVKERRQLVQKTLNKHLISDVANIVFNYEYFIDSDTLNVANIPFVNKYMFAFWIWKHQNISLIKTDYNNGFHNVSNTYNLTEFPEISRIIESTGFNQTYLTINNNKKDYSFLSTHRHPNIPVDSEYCIVELKNGNFAKIKIHINHFHIYFSKTIDIFYQ